MEHKDIQLCPGLLFHLFIICGDARIIHNDWRAVLDGCLRQPTADKVSLSGQQASHRLLLRNNFSSAKIIFRLNLFDFKLCHRPKASFRLSRRQFASFLGLLIVAIGETNKKLSQHKCSFEVAQSTSAHMTERDYNQRTKLSVFCPPLHLFGRPTACITTIFIPDLMLFLSHAWWLFQFSFFFLSVSRLTLLVSFRLFSGP